MEENEVKRPWNAGRMSLSLDNDTHIETVILLEKPVRSAHKKFKGREKHDR